MTLLADLEARLEESGGEGVLGFLAERLGNAEAMGEELADTEGTIREAEEAEGRSEAWLMDAFEQFPIVNAQTFPTARTWTRGRTRCWRRTGWRRVRGSTCPRSCAP